MEFDHRAAKIDVDTACDAARAYMDRNLPGLKHTNSDAYTRFMSMYVSNYIDHLVNKVSLEQCTKADPDKNPWD